MQARQVFPAQPRGGHYLHRGNKQVRGRGPVSGTNGHSNAVLELHSSAQTSVGTSCACAGQLAGQPSPHHGCTVDLVLGMQHRQAAHHLRKPRERLGDMLGRAYHRTCAVKRHSRARVRECSRQAKEHGKSPHLLQRLVGCCLTQPWMLQHV